MTSEVLRIQLFLRGLWREIVSSEECSLAYDEVAEIQVYEPELSLLVNPRYEISESSSACEDVIRIGGRMTISF